MPENEARINVSVAVLEERLARWAETVQKSLDSLRDDLRRRDEKYDDQIGSLIIWRVQHQAEYNALFNKVESLLPDVDSLKKSFNEGFIAGRARSTLLKSQWTIIAAGILVTSTIVGIITQLGLIQFGGG